MQTKLNPCNLRKLQQRGIGLIAALFIVVIVVGTPLWVGYKIKHGLKRLEQVEQARQQQITNALARAAVKFEVIVNANGTWDIIIDDVNGPPVLTPDRELAEVDIFPWVLSLRYWRLQSAERIDAADWRERLVFVADQATAEKMRAEIMRMDREQDGPRGPDRFYRWTR